MSADDMISGKSRLSDKWGSIAMQAGFLAIPTTLLRHQHRIGLSPLELNVVLQILKHWIETENLPHPSKVGIAAAIGVNSRTVQRCLSQLQRRGLISRVAGQTGRGHTPRYKISGLVHAITMAMHEVDEVTTNETLRYAPRALSAPSSRK